LPNTLIKVCPGIYEAGGAGTGITVNTSNIKIQGVLSHSGAQTLFCDTTADPMDSSFGIKLLGSDDAVQYMTIEDCDLGVVSGGTTTVKTNGIWNNWFNGDYTSIGTELGNQVSVKDNWITNSFFAIESIADEKDTITGNTIEGDGSLTQDGIYAELGVSACIKNNVVTGVEIGLDFSGDVSSPGGFNTFATVTSNHFDGNAGGVILRNNNSGNTFESNYANGNGIGFGSDATNGDDAVPTSGPNKFLKNTAFGNLDDDYVDLTFGYTGHDPNTNAGTADWWMGNKGNTADPPALLFQ
jgi:hypothetical protein